jgi:hypothetical protein|uniref:Uncharacterized protein n=1 Tax=Desulfobacca acetoxidans TaxID=60893 RepID=A0A7C5EPG1_9BACT
MCMWFYDEAGELEEYRIIKKEIRAVEREYAELLNLLGKVRLSLRRDPQNQTLQIRQSYLEKRVKHLEEKFPWLTWETPIEVALFSPPHG